MSFDQLLEGAVPPHKNNPMNNLSQEDLVKLLKLQIDTKDEAKKKEKLDEKLAYQQDSKAWSKAYDQRMQKEAKKREEDNKHVDNER